MGPLKSLSLASQRLHRVEHPWRHSHALRHLHDGAASTILL
jgi:hypothetical protein